MEHTSEDLEHFSAQQQDAAREEKPSYTPRPLSHRVLAWFLVVVVLFAFLGTCHWLVNYR